MAPPFPSERKRLSIRTGLLTCAFTEVPTMYFIVGVAIHLPGAEFQWSSTIALAGTLLRCLTSAQRPILVTGLTHLESGALTVAGQWRNFTAFPNILMIEVVT